MRIRTNHEKNAELGIAALKFVDDPEIGLNVVDLGLIYELAFPEGEVKVVCTMTLTTEFCPMGESIMANVTAALKMALPGYSVQVELIFTPPWSHELISEEGREFLERH